MLAPKIFAVIKEVLDGTASPFYRSFYMYVVVHVVVRGRYDSDMPGPDLSWNICGFHQELRENLLGLAIDEDIEDNRKF